MNVLVKLQPQMLSGRDAAAFCCSISRLCSWIATSYFIECEAGTTDFVDDLVCFSSPQEWSWIVVVMIDVIVDGVLKLVD